MLIFIIVAIILAIALWPHWLGTIYENNQFNATLISPPFKTVVTKRKIFIYLFNKEFYTIGGDKSRRKKVTKRLKKLKLAKLQ